MRTIESQLDQVDGLLAKGHGREPQAILRQLISEMGRAELAEWRMDIQRLIERFQPKRRADLQVVLRQALELGRPERAPARVSGSEVDFQALEESLRSDLSELSRAHIFQWSTFYRDSLTLHFSRFLKASAKGRLDEAILVSRRSFAEHANEIFAKGYVYVRGQFSFSQNDAIQKEVAGLSKFLDVIVELYSAHVAASPDPATYLCVRGLASGLISGILEGFGACRFGVEGGSQILPKFPRAWGHYYAFLNLLHAQQVTSLMEPAEFTEGVKLAVLPAIGAVDDLISRSRDYAPMPVLGQLVWDQGRLDLALRPSIESEAQALVEVNCFLNESSASVYAIQEAEARGASLVIAPLKPDVREFVHSRRSLKNVVVETGEAVNPDEVRRAALARLDEDIYQRYSPRSAGRPLTYNIARDFPLRNPFKVRYFHVPRTSVRDLLKAFERRNGVRLWCSVRRSGKTTACLDLGSSTGSSVVVGQTCDSTELVENAHLFYDLVLQALDGGSQLSPTFVAESVLRCAPPHAAEGSRYVLVVDEYETLFGRLRAAVRRDADIRYTVVQPLLNQLVAFTKDNLLVLLGQQPNAHFILMDQNQLSAYVEQDSFPLFQHTDGTSAGEFAELVRKILTDRIPFDGGFADALYAETAGHPFLTANVLVEVVEWLIAKERPAKGLRLRRDDFQEFATIGLTEERLRLSSEYDFFRAAVADATSLSGAQTNAWLHAVYRVLHLIAQHSPKKLKIARGDFKSLCEVARVSELGFDPDELLRSGSQANFLLYDDTSVEPKVRVLGRIAGITRPMIDA